MKVLSIVTNRHATFYKKQTAALSKKGVDITHVYPPKQSTDHKERQEIERTKLDYVKLYKDILSEALTEYDLVHANYGIMAPFALAQLHRPIVITYWGSDLMGEFGTINSKLTNFFDEVILPSPALTEHVSCDHQVVPFGIDTDLFRPISKDKARSEIGWGKNKNYILFPYGKKRDVKNFLLAERVVDQANQDVEIVAISGVEYEQMPYYMSASDAVLITSKREAGPMVLKEAALCNVPVISTDVGFAAEALSDVKNSYVCITEAKLVKRLNEVLGNDVRSDGEKYADQWGLDRMGESLIEVYKSAISKY